MIAYMWIEMLFFVRIFLHSATCICWKLVDDSMYVVILKKYLHNKCSLSYANLKCD